MEIMAYGHASLSPEAVEMAEKFSGESFLCLVSSFSLKEISDGGGGEEKRIA